nr:MAG TPA: hypothetical protein [Bacteriophage sp.]
MVRLCQGIQCTQQVRLSHRMVAQRRLNLKLISDYEK